MAKMPDWPQMKPCTLHREYVGMMKFRKDGAWRSACPMCEKAGTPLGVIIEDGRIIREKQDS